MKPHKWDAEDFKMEPITASDFRIDNTSAAIFTLIFSILALALYAS